MNCERCHEAIVISTCSRYNAEQICMTCAEDETTLPSYQECKAAETQAVLRGDNNFCFGLTAQDRETLRKLRTSRSTSNGESQ